MVQDNEPPVAFVNSRVDQRRPNNSSLLNHNCLPHKLQQLARRNEEVKGRVAGKVGTLEEEFVTCTDYDDRIKREIEIMKVRWRTHRVHFSDASSMY